MTRALGLLAIAALLSGCAYDYARGSKRSHARWDSMRRIPDVNLWMSCIGAQSWRWLDWVTGFPPEIEKAREGKTKWQIFMQVLAACEPEMKGPGWSQLSLEQQSNLVSDAYHQFRFVEFQIEDSQTDYF